MLNKIEVTNAQGSILSLPMEESDNGYQVAEIEGLDPVKASLVSSDYAGSDGEVFQSAKRGARNIKMTLDLDPDFNPKGYTELRNDLYPFFMPKGQINLRFFLSTGLYLDIEGVVEEMEAPLFEQEPQVDISIMCYQPDFVDGRRVALDLMTVDDMTNEEIVYPGTVESGTVLTLNLNRDLTDFTIYNSDEGGNTRQLDFTGELLDGDQLVISSLRGSKGITLTRSAVSSSYLYGRSAQSSWIELTRGINNFRVYAEGDPIPYTLEYVVRYGGL